MNLEGTWLMVVSVATLAKVPVIGETRSVSESTVVANIVREQGEYRLVPDTCGSVLVGGPKIAKTIIPQAFVRSLPDTSYPVSLEDRSGVYHFRADAGVQDVGWTGKGSWPLAKNDPRITDSDGDGHPGATVLVKVKAFGTGEIYVVQSGQTRFEGRAVSEDRIEGGLDVEIRQETIGASHSFLKASTEAKFEASKSGFVLTRLPMGTTCADLATPAVR